MASAEAPAVRLVATDIDGTLFTPAHTVPEESRDAIAKLGAARIPLVLATGKIPGPWSEDLLAGVACAPYAVFSNGGLIVDVPKREHVYEATLDRALVERVVAAAEALPRVTQIAVSLQGRDHPYQLFANEALDAPTPTRAVEWIAGAGEHPPRSVGALGAFLKAHAGVVVNRLWMATESADSAHRGSAAAAGEAGFDALLAAVRGAVAQSGVEAEILAMPVLLIEGLSVVEVMPAGQSKAAALRKVLGLLELPAESMMALGDGQNDLEMLRLAGVPVVMGNAPEGLKAAALEGKARGGVTAKNTDGGWAAAVEKYALAPPLPAAGSRKRARSGSA